MSQAESKASITGPLSEDTPRGTTGALLEADLDGLHPPLVAFGDVLVGSLLFRQFASVFGLLVAGLGVVVLCSLAYQKLLGNPA